MSAVHVALERQQKSTFFISLQSSLDLSEFAKAAKKKLQSVRHL